MNCPTVLANATQRLPAHFVKAMKPSVEILNRRAARALYLSFEPHRRVVAQAVAGVAREVSARVPSEVKEGAAAVAAYRDGDEGPLWKWAEELIDRKPDSLMRVKLGSDVTRFGDDLTVWYTFALLGAYKRRLEEPPRARRAERVSRQLYESMGKSSRRDYMRALRGHEVPPKEMLWKVLPGAVSSLDVNMPLHELRPEAQKIIKDDNRPLVQTRTPDIDENGEERSKMVSLDALAEAGKEFEDPHDLAAFAQMEEERRALNRLGAVGLTQRELEVVRLQLAGLCPEEIADALNIARGTIYVHVRNIGKKLSA